MVTAVNSFAAISGATQASGTHGVAASQQRRLSLGTLSQALLSGNLAAAQKAYGSLSATYPGGTITNAPNSPLAKIGQALNSGNLAAAQSALPSLNGAGRSYRAASGGAGMTAANTSFAETLTSLGGNTGGSFSVKA
jgi:hypothetical protein